MRKQRWLGASAALVSLMLVLAACSTPGTSAEESAAESAGSPSGSVAPAGFKACQVTDTGGVDDQGFNQNAYEGLTRAESELGIDIALLESTADTDYAPNLATFAAQGCDVIITVGFLLGSATQAAAVLHPDIDYAIVDFAYDDPPPNLKGLVFDMKSASMLQGYLAAGMSDSGIIGTWGGIQIPPVVDFMNGLVAGVNYYNEENGTSVSVLGWDAASQTGSFINNFDDEDAGRALSEGFMQEGADVIFAVAGPAGRGGMAAVQANPAGLDPAPMFIGVDVDQFLSVPGFEDIMLSSALKRIDNAVFEAVKESMEGGFSADLYVGLLSNEGVGMAPFHNFDAAVPQALKDGIAALQAALIDGSVTVDAYSGQPAA